MRYWSVIFALLWLVPALARGQPSAPDEITVTADGVAAVTDDPAAAEDEAVWDAKRCAVEQAAGIFLRARSVGHDLKLEEDEIREETRGFIRRWEIVPGSRRVTSIAGGRVLRLSVRAVVALLPVIRRLADMQDVYQDLERPRVRVQIEGNDTSLAAQNTILAVLKSLGFEIASSGAAEITLDGRLTIMPTVRLGDSDSPYQVGEQVAACRARLNMRVLSAASEEVLLTAQADGAGQSFQSDSEARSAAIEAAAGALMAENAGLFVQHLLVRWARERQEGYVVAVQVTGLDAHRRALLKEFVRSMRGFRKITDQSSDSRFYTLRFLTRLDARSIRRRLAALRLDGASLIVQNHTGAIIVCGVSAAPRLSRKP